MNKALLDAIYKAHPDVSVVMASKYLETLDDFQPFLDEGVTHFGENRVEALLKKQSLLKDYPTVWHFIGTLQTKKVKQVINNIDVLHALDREKLAVEIENRRIGVLPCYIQVNISEEPQKHGFEPTEVEAFINQTRQFEHLQIIGLMGMAEETADETLIRKQFMRLKTLRDRLEEKYPTVTGLSMGMSQDYHIALEVGTTVLRLGRILLAEDLYGTKSQTGV